MSVTGSLAECSITIKAPGENTASRFGSAGRASHQPELYGGSANMIVNRISCLTSHDKARRISSDKTILESESLRLRFMSSARFLTVSTKTALFAPRLNASIPTRPVPAKRSRNSAPSITSPNMLNSADITRPEVGRISFMTIFQPHHSAHNAQPESETQESSCRASAKILHLSAQCECRISAQTHHHSSMSQAEIFFRH